MKSKKGISLIVTVITIIIMIIIAGAVILTFTGTDLIDQADSATKKYNKQQYKTMIGNEYAILRTSEEAKGKTTEEKYLMLKDKMGLVELEWEITTNTAYIEVNDEYTITLFEDGTIKDGKTVILDIANGGIEIKSKGYVQGKTKLTGGGYNLSYAIEGSFVQYDGDYIITGTSTENMIRVVEEGTYNITFRDLNIDVSSIDGRCAFNANRNNMATGVFVNLYLEGNNTLISIAPAIGFAGAEPDIENIENASKLTIQGTGKLYAQGHTGIGTGYVGGPDAALGDANNITINGGDIKAKGVHVAIGGGLRRNVNNLIINDGNIETVFNNKPGIGTYSNESGHGNLKNLQINGGNITAYGGEYGAAIGGVKSANKGEIKITGGKLNLINNGDIRFVQSSALGIGCSKIEIAGGTINCETRYKLGIGTVDKEQNINVTGGTILINSAEKKFAVPPKSGEQNVFLTELQLEGVTEEIQITAFTTSDKLNYGIKDMYTTNEGKLYLYLPTGERNITIKAGNKEYTGKVITGEADSTEVVVLNVK